MLLGPKLPFKMYDSAMVTSPDGQGVLLVGGYNDDTNEVTNLILELNGETMEWNFLKQTLKWPRKGHVAFQIPDSLVKNENESNNEKNIFEQTEPSWKKNLWKKVNKVRKLF